MLSDRFNVDREKKAYEDLSSQHGLDNGVEKAPGAWRSGETRLTDISTRRFFVDNQLRLLYISLRGPPGRDKYIFQEINE